MTRLFHFSGRHTRRAPGFFAPIFLFRLLLVLMICLLFYYLLRRQRQHFSDLQQALN